ncbi:MAG TPA: OmpA family protein [Victivallales bacterium]|nr:OmpA family protein [Victivallales bacterium]
MKEAKRIVLPALLAISILMTGCSTLSDWFGWGDEETPEDIAGNLPPPTDTLAPGAWGNPGDGVSSRPGEWTPVPGVSLPTIYFAYDSSEIGASEQAKLEYVANYMLQNKQFKLILEGHCDERGSVEYNRALGERRAISIRDALVKLGVIDANMQTISYGEEKPAITGSDENAWSKNRRGELILAR